MIHWASLNIQVYSCQDKTANLIKKAYFGVIYLLVMNKTNSFILSCLRHRNQTVRHENKRLDNIDIINLFCRKLEIVSFLSLVFSMKRLLLQIEILIKYQAKIRSKENCSISSIAVSLISLYILRRVGVSVGQRATNLSSVKLWE